VVAGVVGIAATCRWYLETDEVEISGHSEEIEGTPGTRRQDSAYGRNVNQRYPTGDVVVCERDLAEQLRKAPDSVATALDLTFG